MAWTYYPLKLRLLSPLHIGYRKVGNLMQTRPYVPGKVLWAALTARLTRMAGKGADGQAYQDTGAAVRRHFRLGYLWPSLDGTSPYWPWEHEDFDYLLLNSYASTALNYDQQSAEEGSLHETEFMAPVARNGQAVHLVGDLWVREGDLPDALRGWKDAFQKLQLGGERTYGWGRVACCSEWSDGQRGSGTTTAGHIWREQNGEIVLTLPVDKDKRLTAHAVATGERGVSGIVGPVEPLVGWERDNENSGRTWRLSTALICWAPDSRPSEDIAIQVGPYGIWEAVSP